MNEHKDELRTVWWDNDNVCLIDQRFLPHRQVVVHCHTLQEVADAIQTMQVRGAPAIGCTAAYGMALAALNGTSNTLEALVDALAQAKTLLDAQRPTAVNLSWATTRIARCVEDTLAARNGNPPSLDEVRQCVLDAAHTVVAEDLAMCHAIGSHGAPLIPERGHVLTHCNAGGLATAGYGTALAPLRTAREQGRKLHIYVDETRPYLQGARLTSWELQQEHIDQTLVPDNMAGYLMSHGEVDCVIVGADRIVANGDVANKIGTYMLAVLAHVHQVPFYVAAPSSTIDLACQSGTAIPIEERSSDEVTHVGGYNIAPEGVSAAHPAFDVTPHSLITAIITERGVIYPPFMDGLHTYGVPRS
jgi:methylthioribose-1-phosphate isomerase